MIKHIVMWKLKNASDAKRFSDLLNRCHHLVPGMMEFEVAIASPKFEAMPMWCCIRCLPAALH
jgi:hypothetical protein